MHLPPFIRFRFRYDASQQQQQPISSGKSSPTSESDKNKAGQSEQSGESRGETSGEVTGGESAEEEEEKEDAEGDDERTEDDTSTFPFFEWTFNLGGKCLGLFILQLFFWRFFKSLAIKIPIFLRLFDSRFVKIW